MGSSSKLYAYYDYISVVHTSAEHIISISMLLSTLKSRRQARRKSYFFVAAPVQRMQPCTLDKRMLSSLCHSARMQIVLMF